MSALTPEPIEFSGGQQAVLLQVPRDTPGAAILAALKLPPPRALVLLNGGTAQLPTELGEQLRSLLHAGLARVAAEEQITLITGGTDAGIFALLGEGIAKWRPAVRCVGVVPSGPVRWPGRESGDTALESHHTHFVVAEGKDWGDETTTMYALAAAFTCPSLAVFAGGGKITLREMQANVDQGREMILIAGSGRNTDAVLAARGGAEASDPAIAKIARDGRITAFDLRESAAAFASLVKTRLAL